VKKESNSQAMGSAKRKYEPQISKPENKKVKLEEPESEEGMSKQILQCIGSDPVSFNHNYFRSTNMF
jgi:hypothetical protein